MKSILLDTNAYSRYALGDKVINRIVKQADIIFISSISVGELYSGFRQGVSFEANELKLKNFLTDTKVIWLRVSLKTARIYGQVVFELYKRGMPIPTNDIWITAQVIETGAELVTYDRHFLQVPGLKIWQQLPEVE